MDTKLILYVIIGYLLGSISPGILLGKRLKGIDIRQHGSGNSGATNVLRTLGPAAAITAFSIDILKGVVAVLLGRSLGDPIAPLLCGGAAVIGHNWPLYVGFRGGKGVATAAGIIFTLFPAIGFILLAVFVVMVAITRYVSLSSMTAAALAIPAAVFLNRPGHDIVFLACLAALIIWRHQANIKRLLSGTENKLGSKSKK